MKSKSKPQPKMSKHGFMLYPVYFRGVLVYVTVPEN